MQTTYLAYITIVQEVQNPPVQPPLGIWGPNDPRPTHPIAGWNPGSGTFPPYQPPYPSQGPGFPTHPIQLPPWAGGWQPYPDQGLPMPQPPFPSQPPLGIWGPNDPRPTHPIAGWNPGTGTFPPYQPPYPSQGPGFPTHPIQLPPWAGGWQPYPDQGLPMPQPPLGGSGGIPENPINRPPATELEPPNVWKFAYIPGMGWAWVVYNPETKSVTAAPEASAPAE